MKLSKSELRKRKLIRDFGDPKMIALARRRAKSKRENRSRKR
jgi:hypothetical protein